MSSSFAEQKTEMLQRGWRPVVIEGEVVWLPPDDPYWDTPREREMRETADGGETDYPRPPEDRPQTELIESTVGDEPTDQPYYVEGGDIPPEEPWTPPEKIFVEDARFPYGTLSGQVPVDWAGEKALYRVQKGQSGAVQWFGFEELKEMTQYTPESITQSQEDYLEWDILHREQVHKKREAKEEYATSKAKAEEINRFIEGFNLGDVSKQELEALQEKYPDTVLDLVGGGTISLGELSPFTRFEPQVVTDTAPRAAQLILGKTPMDLGLELGQEVAPRFVVDPIATGQATMRAMEDVEWKYIKAQEEQFLKTKAFPTVEPRTWRTPPERAGAKPGSIGAKASKFFTSIIEGEEAAFKEITVPLGEESLKRITGDMSPKGVLETTAGISGLILKGAIEGGSFLVRPRLWGQTAYGLTRVVTTAPVIFTKEGRATVVETVQTYNPLTEAGRGEIIETAKTVHPLGLGGIALETFGQVVGGYVFGKAVSDTLKAPSEKMTVTSGKMEVDPTSAVTQLHAEPTGRRIPQDVMTMFGEEMFPEEVLATPDELAVVFDKVPVEILDETVQTRSMAKIKTPKGEVEQALGGKKGYEVTYGATEIDEIARGNVDDIAKEFSSKYTAEQAGYREAFIEGIVEHRPQTGEFGGMWFDEATSRDLPRGVYKFEVKGGVRQTQEIVEETLESGAKLIDKPPEGFKGTPLSKTFGGTTQEAEIVMELVQAEKPVIFLKTAQPSGTMGAMAGVSIPSVKQKDEAASTLIETPLQTGVFTPQTPRPVTPTERQPVIQDVFDKPALTPTIKPRLNVIEISRPATILTPTITPEVTPTIKDVPVVKPATRTLEDVTQVFRPTVTPVQDPRVTPIEKPTTIPVITPTVIPTMTTITRVTPVVDQVSQIAQIEMLKQVEIHHRPMPSPMRYDTTTDIPIPWGIRMGGRRTRATWGLAVFGERRKYPVKDPLKVYEGGI